MTLSYTFDSIKLVSIGKLDGILKTDYSASSIYRIEMSKENDIASISLFLPTVYESYIRGFEFEDVLDKDNLRLTMTLTGSKETISYDLNTLSALGATIKSDKTIYVELPWESIVVGKHPKSHMGIFETYQWLGLSYNSKVYAVIDRHLLDTPKRKAFISAWSPPRQFVINDYAPITPITPITPTPIPTQTENISSSYRLTKIEPETGLSKHVYVVGNPDDITSYTFRLNNYQSLKIDGIAVKLSLQKLGEGVAIPFNPNVSETIDDKYNSCLNVNRFEDIVLQIDGNHSKVYLHRSRLFLMKDGQVTEH